MVNPRNTILWMEEIALKDTVLHRIKPLSHLLVTLVFLLIVASFDQYTVSSLFPLFLYPAVALVLGDIPVGFLFRALLRVLPVILFLGLANPFFDPGVFELFPGCSINAGWITAFTLILRGLLTVSAALILLALTGMPGFILALGELKVPGIFITLLGFTYRYIGILQEEALSMVRAYKLRSPRSKGLLLKDWGPFGGQWFIRTSQRADRIHRAISCRGNLNKGFLFSREKASSPGYAWTVFWFSYCILCRTVDLPAAAGQWITGGTG